MRLLLTLLCLAVASLPAQAQSAPPTTLTLDQALEIAAKNNPVYQQSVLGRRRAQAQVRTAYGQFLPSADGSFGLGFREGRPQNFGGINLGATSDILSSSWNLSASQRLSWNTFNRIKQANASLDAADAEVDAARFNLGAQVTQQFLLALQTQARAALQDTLVLQQRLQLELANARAGVGALTSLDVKRAEVGLGQQEVAALRARNAADVAKLQLFQQLGVAMPMATALVADLQVSAPTFTADELLDAARQGNPSLQAVKAREVASAAALRSARGDYTPTLGFNASVSAFTQKLVDLPATATPEQRAENARYPFDFTRNPYNLSVGLSIPIFDGLGRESRLQEAGAAREEAAYNVRRQELQLTADVTSAYVTLVAAHRAVELQQRTAATAREALDLAQERYRVGANTFVDLTTARAEYERAETDRIDAVYEFHRAFAALEGAVGRSLR
ncbi:MAG: TolC family protein [Gemmatimonadaceae bacterium]|nr:TolC family protein [Gemmatimonadaceae bacterium]MCW5826288.1 TolC family protein [Gemmatimonadaceae bacterium]